MDDFYNKLEKATKLDKTLKIADIADVVGKNYDATRLAIKRKSFSVLEIKEIEKLFAKTEQGKKGEIEQLTVKEPFEQFVVTNKNGLEISNMPDGGFLMRVPLVPVKAYARYISEGDSAEFLENAEYVFFRVDHVARGRYLAFVIKGDSFWNEGGYDTPDKAIALGRELQRNHWKDGFRDSDLGWIIVTKHNIVIKDIIHQDLEKGMITCHSRNPSPEYSDFTLSLDEDVKSIWKVIKRQF